MLLQCSGVDSSGSVVSFKWKAYEPHGGDLAFRLRWELRWFLQDCCYEEAGSKRLWRHISDNFARWQAALESSGLPAGAHLGLSRHALSKKVGREADVASAEQEHWTSTPGLISLLADWSKGRRQVRVRERVRLLGRLLFERTLSLDVCLQVTKLRLSDLELRACQEQPVDMENRCFCMQQVLLGESSWPEASSPQDAVFLKLSALSAGKACVAVRRLLFRCVQLVSEAIESSPTEWGESQWHRSGSAHLQSLCKRRRIDFHVKQFAMQVAVADQSAPTVAAAVRQLDSCDGAQGLRWIQCELASYRASTCLSFRSLARSFSVAVDATRIGKPAKEVIIGFVSSGDRHGVLPPQALLWLDFGKPSRQAGKTVFFPHFCPGPREPPAEPGHPRGEFWGARTAVAPGADNGHFH